MLVKSASILLKEFLKMKTSSYYFYYYLYKVPIIKRTMAIILINSLTFQFHRLGINNFLHQIEFLDNRIRKLAHHIHNNIQHYHLHLDHQVHVLRIRRPPRSTLSPSTIIITVERNGFSSDRIPTF